jgi:hypothetical protein
MDASLGKERCHSQDIWEVIGAELAPGRKQKGTKSPVKAHMSVA